MDGDAGRLGGLFDGGEKVEVILQRLHRRHEHADRPLARLDGDRGAHGAADHHLLDWGGRGLGGAHRAVDTLVSLDDGFGHDGRRRQGLARLQRVLFVDKVEIDGRDVGQGRQRQAIANRRVARHEVEAPTAQAPLLAFPARFRFGIPALHRQHEADRLGQPPAERPDHPVTLFRILDLWIERIDVDGEIALLDNPGRRIFVSGDDMVRRDAEAQRQAFGKPERLVTLGRIPRLGIRLLDRLFGGARARHRRDKVGIAPDRRAVLAPVETESPARQGLAGIPFALAEVEHAARREAGPQLADQLVGQRPLRGTNGAGIPLVMLEVVDRYEGGFAAHGEADIVVQQVSVDLLTQRVELFPGLVREGQRDARLFGDAGDPHVEGELDLGFARHAGNRRGGAIMRGGADGNVPLAAKQTRGDVHADPAGTGDIGLGPGVEVGEVDLGALRAFDRIDIGLELDEVAGDEARGDAEVAQQLDQQPSGIPARAGFQRQGFFRRLHARLHADRIGDRLLQPGIGLDEKIGGTHRPLGQGGDIGLEMVAERLRLEIGQQLRLQFGVVGEGEVFGIGFDEEVERIVDGEFGREIDLDLELRHLVGKDDARQPVAAGVLQPVQKMVGRRDFERVGRDRGPAMRRRTQPDGLGTEFDRSVVFVMREMIDRG